jgi:hypothetical protein
MLVKFSEKELNAIADWDRVHNIPKNELLSLANISLLGRLKQPLPLTGLPSRGM